MSNFLRSLFFIFFVSSFVNDIKCQFFSNNITYDEYIFEINDKLTINQNYNAGKLALTEFLIDLAHIHFYSIMESDSLTHYPETLYYLGEIYRYYEDYDMAKQYYQAYLMLPEHKDDFCYSHTMELLDNYENIYIYQKTDENITTRHLPSPLNTPYSEFAAMEYGDAGDIFFSSYRPSITKQYSSLFTPFFKSDIYKTYYLPKGLAVPQKIILSKSSKQTHNANLTFSPSQKFFSFTQCEYSSENCKIYWGEIDDSNNFINIKPVSINSDKSNQTHPFLILDENGNGILFFTSNRPGGYGGYDLYFSIIKNFNFQVPINLGPVINTPGDEITPYYDIRDSTLYFSSNFHIGLGGYDIFLSKGYLNSWQKVKNIGSPINSPFNDFYFYRNSYDFDGYFSSNRKNSYFIQGQYCCYDIYTFYVEEKKLTITEPEITYTISLNDTINPLKEDIISLLPITVYFHNDIPDPRSWDTTTKYSYDELYFAYLKLIDKYKKEYSKGLKGEDKLKAMQEMEAFFNEEVIGGFDKLQRFTNLLLEDLKNGSSVTIKINGYCSPLHTSEYNINLSKRRISSLKNYLLKINNGELAAFIEGTHPSGGKLRIIEEPMGKELASPYASDNPQDVQKSIYSIAAAQERRAQISSYISDFKGSTLVYESGIYYTDSSFICISTSQLKNINSIDIPIYNIGNAPFEIEILDLSKDCVQTMILDPKINPDKKTYLTVLLKEPCRSKPGLITIKLKTNIQGDELHLISILIISD
ncbi:MAG TPA: hypothetical protein PLS14_04105 [Bacteroidales bacterium]|nr:hypothetical protein [Bacteroidales bacterium]HOB77776.1 hypothetical protein [Bacteroidales bacterium]HPZ61122.1 hypothetical protein [Bacteroidales bacterium]HQD58783.1 hypothetical protein [Bacteroidales bacterium]